MRSMKRPLAVPVLHMRGDADPYVLADAGGPDPALRAARPLRIHRRAPGISATRKPGRGQRTAVTVPGPALTDIRSGVMHVPVAHPLGVAHLAIAGDTSLAVSTKPVSASSTAAPNTTPSTCRRRSISGPPELPCRTVPLMV